MRLRQLTIKNFRGIELLNWEIPDHKLLCLIGPGDAGKSTVLEAIRRLFHPQWNLAFDDADFFQCDTANSIEITGVLGRIPHEFRELSRYGGNLCGWNIDTREMSENPGDGLEDSLCARLTVTDSLEPNWSIIQRDEEDGVPFRPSDREKVSAHLVGESTDRHLRWARGSMLSQITEAENIAASLALANRAAKEAVEGKREEHLKGFDNAAGTAEETARELGVGVAANYKAHLDSDVFSMRSSGLALHEGNVPLRRLGLGSKRLVASGLQRMAKKAPHITLFDEVEAGLEPHRIARLLKHLKDDQVGQYFLATHSPVVLRELTVEQLFILHKAAGKCEVVPAAQPDFSDMLQGKIRSGAEAFLAPKVLVCEGATEVGFLRGLEDFWVEAECLSFAYRGASLFDAVGGNKVKSTALGLKALKYDVAVLVDSDEPKEFNQSDVETLLKQGIAVGFWAGEMSIEERVFADLPWEGVMKSFNAYRAMKEDDEAVANQVQSKFGEGFERDHSIWSDSAELRTALGKAAKNSEWFKRQDRARVWGYIVAGHLTDANIAGTSLVRVTSTLKKWIENE